MPGIISTKDATLLPPAAPDQKYVTVSPMTAGHITLPEYIFYEPSDPDSMKYVPSLAFLIQHPDAALFAKGVKKPFRLMFDLGVRADPLLYVPVLQKHIKSRSPIAHRPSVKDHLVSGGVDPRDIDAVAISHVHWDHHGDPQDFPNATFFLGPGALSVLKNGLPGTGNHSVFDPDLLEGLQVAELETPPSEQHGDCVSAGTSEDKYHEKRVHFHGVPCKGIPTTARSAKPQTASKPQWAALGPFAAAYDLLGDGSVYIINAPGHLYGHINLLCRTGLHKWVYLGGDTFHHTRMLTGEKRITTYPDESGSGRTCCIHVDKVAAQRSLEMVGVLLDSAQDADYEIECIVAHDVDWLAGNQHRLFPKCL
ncbi:hypothetical protein MMC19_007307 [Ptychographa xylographoides]|nr:hypothetical protein [Ptychographa xylographoides]